MVLNRGQANVCQGTLLYYEIEITYNHVAESAEILLWKARIDDSVSQNVEESAATGF